MIPKLRDPIEFVVGEYQETGKLVTHKRLFNLQMLAGPFIGVTRQQLQLELPSVPHLKLEHHIVVAAYVGFFLLGCMVSESNNRTSLCPPWQTACKLVALTSAENRRESKMRTKVLQKGSEIAAEAAKLVERHGIDILYSCSELPPSVWDAVLFWAARKTPAAAC